MSKRAICSIIRIGSIAAALTVLREMYKIGVAGYIMVSLAVIAWSIAEDIKDKK